MKCDILVGGQWGDEGKAKIIDFLSNKYHIVCRFQGGSNAGHTVFKNGVKYVFHLLPSSVLHPQTTAVLSHGMVIYLPQLVKEIQTLEKEGISFEGRLFISDKAFLVMDYHLEIDKVKEQKENKVGTTCKGIGPAYTDKYDRKGIRVGDLFDEGEVLNKIKSCLDEQKNLLKNYYQHDYLVTAEEILEKTLKDFKIIQPYVIDTTYYLNHAISQKNILLEGAQGAGLDIDFGTYPFVTSSSPTSGGAATGTGIAVNHFQKIYGVFKAYVTRVGKGSLPTILSNEENIQLRDKGKEFGATTGRQRSCGWFDGVQAKYSLMINGVTDLVITKLDVFTGYKKIKFCTHYIVDGFKTDMFPPSNQKLKKAEPVYIEFEGWEDQVYQVQTFDELHPNAQKFINYFEEYLGLRISIISTGPEKQDTIVRN
ncbi:adenylosuccinate synthetase-like [Ylistrum balloti]|uniref:adenylosuccinate synthetase-like n=1 Tax=Ylistrum balloti TaxID=509963 RepID=UPI0029059B7B|nr:adenylosuccinate synthetase-like [Ylistrum balloti]